MGNAVFRGMPAPRPLDRFSKKIGTIDYVVDPTPHARIGINWFKGGVSAHAWNCRPQASIFFSFFFDFMRIATGRPVGPIVVVNGSNDASSWPSRPFYGFVNKKNIFSLFFTQKCEKLHYALWQIRTAITREPLKIDASCFHQTGGFRGRAIEWCHSNLPQTDPCCHGKQSYLFQHKIGYNSA